MRTRTHVGAFLVCAFTASTLVTGAAATGMQSRPGLRRAGSAGVTVLLPPGWHFYRNGVAPQSMPYGDPLVRVVVASTKIRPLSQGCKAETFRFARGGVGLMIVEWVRPQPGVVWPLRPKKFTAQALPVRQPPAVECWPGPGGDIQFTANGRHFAAYLLLDTRAPLARGAQARAVLDTLMVGKSR